MSIIQQWIFEKKENIINNRKADPKEPMSCRTWNPKPLAKWKNSSMTYLRRQRKRFQIESSGVLCVRGRPVHVPNARNWEMRCLSVSNPRHLETSSIMSSAWRILASHEMDMILLLIWELLHLKENRRQSLTLWSSITYSYFPGLQKKKGKLAVVQLSHANLFNRSRSY